MSIECTEIDFFCTQIKELNVTKLYNGDECMAYGSQDARRKSFCESY